MTNFYQLDLETYSEIEEQVAHLEKIIPSALLTLKLEQAELAELENTLSTFLEAYLAEVGGLFEELKEITAQVNYYSERIKDLRKGVASSTSLTTVRALKKIKKSIENALQNMPFSKNQFKQKEIENIYRELLKALSSSAVQKNTAAVLTLVNKFYIEKNLEGLIRIERKIIFTAGSFRNEEEKLEYLEKEYEDILVRLDAVRIRHHKLIISPAFELQKKFKASENTCKEPVSQMMQEITGKIKEKRKELLQKITYYKFLTAGSYENKASLTAKLTN